MNFLPARVVAQGDALAVRLGDGSLLAVPAARRARYAVLQGREAVLGIRPEHLTDGAGAGRDGFAALAAPAEVVEPMGAETLVHLRIDGTAVCARCAPETAAAPGAPLPLWADMNQMHLMAADTGRMV